MKKEAIGIGKTVEEAILAALKELGVSSDKAEHEILEQPKKGFFGIGEVPAKVRVTCDADAADKGVAFIENLIAEMGITAKVTCSPVAEDASKNEKKERLITIEGEEAGILIGHHGDTLDSLQYLTNLVVNKREEEGKDDYTRITVDIENYRAKREKTLRALASRMASRVLKSGRSVSLEPMSAYERRIIHSEVQGIEGVSTHSVGEDDNRKIVITPERSRRPRRESEGE